MTTLQFIYIDPVIQSVIPLRLDDAKYGAKGGLKLSQVCGLLGCDYGEFVYIDNGPKHSVVMIINEEGALTYNHHFSLPGFAIPFSGPAIIALMSPEDEYIRPLPNVVTMSNGSNHEFMTLVRKSREMIEFWGDDLRLRAAQLVGLVGVNVSTIASMGPDLQPVAGTESVLWQWAPHVSPEAHTPEFVAAYLGSQIPRIQKITGLTEEKVLQVLDITERQSMAKDQQVKAYEKRKARAS